MAPEGGTEQTKAIIGANRVTSISAELNYIKGNCSTSSVEDELVQSKIEVYLCAEQLCIKSENTPITSVQVYDITGRLLYDEKIDLSNQVELELGSYKGAGVVSITLLNGSVAIRKVIL